MLSHASFVFKTATPQPDQAAPKGKTGMKKIKSARNLATLHMKERKFQQTKMLQSRLNRNVSSPLRMTQVCWTQSYLRNSANPRHRLKRRRNRSSPERLFSREKFKVRILVKGGSRTKDASPSSWFSWIKTNISGKESQSSEGNECQASSTTCKSACTGYAPKKHTSVDWVQNKIGGQCATKAIRFVQSRHFLACGYLSFPWRCHTSRTNRNWSKLSEPAVKTTPLSQELRHSIQRMCDMCRIINIYLSQEDATLQHNSAREAAPLRLLQASRTRRSIRFQHYPCNNICVSVTTCIKHTSGR